MLRRSVLRYSTFVPLTLAATRFSLAGKIADPAWLMEGSWLISGEGGFRDRFLILSGVKLKNDRLEIDGATFGYLDGKGAPLHGWRAVAKGDAIDIEFLTPADSVISGTFADGDTAIMGRLNTTGGKEIPVRLTKIPNSELAEMRAANRTQKRLASLRVTRNSQISLLYVGASDCPPCRGYEAEYFGRKNLMAEKFPEFSEVTYEKVHLGSYRGAANLSAALRPELVSLATKGANGEAAQLRCHGTPFFALILDNKVVAQGHGTGALEKLVIPAAREIVERRQKAI
ncbi:MAG: hypothetical protein KGN32_06755 [Burkholderiales bacterium]|nr:hypothetical protein [Burkholderiales bacterium]